MYTIPALRRHLNELYKDEGLHTEIEVVYEDTVKLHFTFSDAAFYENYWPFMPKHVSDIGKVQDFNYTIDFVLAYSLGMYDDIPEREASRCMAYLNENINEIRQAVFRKISLRKFKECIA